MVRTIIIALITLSSSIVLSQNCSDSDLEFIRDNGELVGELSVSCSSSCLTSPDLELCVQQCIQDNTPLSVTCSECFGQQVQCAIDNCLFTCFSEPEEVCAECVNSNCLASFNECAGIVDGDNDTFTTLFDCDDDNSSVYPDAPGTGEGIDNNCDGIIDGAEVALDPCQGDLDGNLAVTVSDLTIFLGFFGCIGENCQGDVDDTPGTTVSDLSIILSNFGLNCF